MRNAKSTIHNLNCLEYIKENPGAKFDYGFTSPPYNRKRNDKYEHYEDKNPEWLEMNKEVIKYLIKSCSKHIFYNIQSNIYNRKEVYELIGHFKDYIVDIHIWEKSNPMPASGQSVTNAVEFFIILHSEALPLKSKGTYTKNIVTTAVNSEMPKNHKAVMKQEVAQHFFDKYIDEGSVVFDPFAGLGTTGIECVKLNCDFVGVELNETYAIQARERINQQLI